MNKDYKKISIFCLITLALTYLAFSFVEFSLNPDSWDISVRVGYVVVLTAAEFLTIFTLKNKK
jgi:hypothetical protein